MDLWLDQQDGSVNNDFLYLGIFDESQLLKKSELIFKVSHIFRTLHVISNPASVS